MQPPAYGSSPVSSGLRPLGVGLRAFPSLTWLELISLPVLIIGFILCLAPGVFLWVSWLVATPALMVEGERGTHALRRSFALVRGRRWPILGLAIVTVLLT